MEQRKIAFFDIDGTITSEKDGSIPDSAVLAIREARENGHLMFINTGRCFQNVEPCFREIGFDGYVCGCGTNIYYHDEELLYVNQTHDVVLEILEQARKTDVDICFESREEVVFDTSRPIHHPSAKRQYYAFKERHYDMSHDPEADDFTCDKFVIWFEKEEQLVEFRKVSDKHFDCIDRGGNFREFVPYHYSKATGIQFLVEHFGLDLEDAYAFGDSNNDLPMLTFVPNSVAMGNAMPEALKDKVSYVTAKASEDGIQKALLHLGFLQ
ncbi:MAG: HAD family hydrolase [Roseburia sp.]